MQDKLVTQEACFLRGGTLANVSTAKYVLTHITLAKENFSVEHMQFC
jgi:hypothetical protein